MDAEVNTNTKKHYPPNNIVHEEEVEEEEKTKEKENENEAQRTLEQINGLHIPQNSQPMESSPDNFLSPMNKKPDENEALNGEVGSLLGKGAAKDQEQDSPEIPVETDRAVSEKDEKLVQKTKGDFLLQIEMQRSVMAVKKDLYEEYSFLVSSSILGYLKL